MLGLAFPAHAGSPLSKGFSAGYKVTYNGLGLGTTTRHLYQRDTSTYEYLSETTPGGLLSVFVSTKVIERSLIVIGARTVQAQSYEYHEIDNEKDTQYNLGFNWPKQVLNNSKHNKQFPLTPHTHDALSYQLALMQGLANGETRFEFDVADLDQIHPYLLSITGKDLVETPHGTYQTLRLTTPIKPNQPHFTLWCSPQLGYLPVKIRKTEKDGTELDLLLLNWKQRP